MDKYLIRYVNRQDQQNAIYAIATDSHGKWGVLSIDKRCAGMPEIAIENKLKDIIHNEACPFVYDHIYPYRECLYNPANNECISFELYVITSGCKNGLFSTLYGDIVLDPVAIDVYKNPVTIDEYKFLAVATTEGLIGCEKVAKLPVGHGYIERFLHVFLNRSGEEIITLEYGWQIVRGFENGKAVIRNNRYEAELDREGTIRNLIERHLNPYLFDDEDQVEREREYRAAFEDNPGAEWNID